MTSVRGILRRLGAGASAASGSVIAADSPLAGGNRTWVRSFGPQNPDKVFYVIWRERGPGLFSIASSTLCHLHLAESLGMIPVVDMENFTSHYNEDHPVNDTRNSWEYYFRPVTDYPLDEVYNSRAVVFCDGSYPAGYSFCITRVAGLDAIWRKYITVDPDVLEFVDAYCEQNIAGSSVLGVHFRGQEFRVAPGHWFPPTPTQMINRAHTLMTDGGYRKIFVVTEEQSYLDLFRREFGDQVIHTDAFRTHEVNAYGIYPRPDHKYLLGRDVLRDTLILSRCNALLCSDSNVSEAAQFLNAGHYEKVSFIDNGPNSNNLYLAKYLWFIKKGLPASLGGFPDE